MTALLTAALYWADAGCSVIPAATDGTKRPFGEWTRYQTDRPSAADHERWFGRDGYDGLGVVCGTVSGGLEMFELEGRAVAEGLDAALGDLMVDNGFGDLWDRIEAGYKERTPSGGVHWLFRVDGEPRSNLKLARRPATADELAENPDEKLKVLIETRGSGGFTIVAPSGGRTHPGRGQWQRLAGSPTTIPSISEDDRDALYAIAAMLDQMPAQESAPRRPQKERPEGEIRPGDDFNDRADWADILPPHGWTEGRNLGSARTWVRPGKDARQGISATTGRNDGDNLFVFSSSTVFDTEKPYSKFAAYTLLEHDGDWTAAARDLAGKGYGTQRPALSLVPPTVTEPAVPLDAPWEIPHPLVIKVPPFPSHVFDWLEEDVVGLSEHLQTPVDLVALITLATVAATVRGRVRVRINDSWTEPLNIYVAAVAGAGETKSPALAVVTKPLRDLEAELQSAVAADVAIAEQRRRVQEGRLAKAEKAAVNANNDDRRAMEEQARLEAETLMAMEVEPIPRLLAADVTAEGLVRLLAEQGGAIAALSAEGGLFDTLAGGRYSNGMANLDAVLQAHDGREPILVDRKVGPPLRVEDPCLTLGLAVQPQVLRAAGGSEAAVGRGFLARFLYSIPESRVGTRRMRREAVSSGFKGFEKVVRGVVAYTELSSVDFAARSYRGDLTLSSLSTDLFYDFLTALEPRRHPITGDLGGPGIGSWANKMDGQLARLAGLIQLIYLANPYTQSTEPPSQVSVRAVSSACEVAEYLIAHAVVAHKLMAGKTLASSDTAVQLLGWLRTHQLDEFSVRDAHASLRRRDGLEHAEGVALAAHVLVQHGYLRPIPQPKGPGRPPSPRFAVSPFAAQEDAA